MRLCAGLLALAGTAACNEATLTGRRPGGGLDTDPLRPAETAPPTAVCSASPAELKPGAAADFVGDASFDVDGIPIVDWRWELITRPSGSGARLPEGTANRVGFAPDLSGTYVARLIVTNDYGSVSASCDATLTVKPEPALWIEAIGELPTDIAIVLARGSRIDGLAPADLCASFACTADWGQSGRQPDDPRALRDAVKNDEQADIVAIPAPADGSYLVGVGNGPEIAFIGKNEVLVRVFAFGELVIEGSVPINGSTVAPVPLFKVDFPAGTATTVP